MPSSTTTTHVTSIVRDESALAGTPQGKFLREKEHVHLASKRTFCGLRVSLDKPREYTTRLTQSGRRGSGDVGRCPRYPDTVPWVFRIASSWAEHRQRGIMRQCLLYHMEQNGLLRCSWSNSDTRHCIRRPRPRPRRALIAAAGIRKDKLFGCARLLPSHAESRPDSGRGRRTAGRAYGYALRNVHGCTRGATAAQPAHGFLRPELDQRSCHCPCC